MSSRFCVLGFAQVLKEAENSEGNLQKNTRTDGSVGSRLLPRSSLRVFWLEEVVCIKNSDISQNVSRSLIYRGFSIHFYKAAVAFL